MEKQIITLPPHYHYKDVFGIAKTLSGTYVCPGWHLVPDGTTRDQIRFDMDAEPWCPPDYDKSKAIIKEAAKPNVPFKTWVVEGSKPGSKYTVVVKDDRWSCTCPASQFRRYADCKHIKSKKEEVQHA